MNDSNFDQHFRDKLGQHRTPVDTDAIWSGVQAGLTGKTSHKPYVWKWVWPLLLLLLLGGLSIGWWMMGSSQSQEFTEAIYIPRSTAYSGAFPEGNEENIRVSTIAAEGENAEGEKESGKPNERAKEAVAEVKEVAANERASISSHRVDHPQKTGGTDEAVDSSSQDIDENAIAEQRVEITGIEKEKDAEAQVVSDPEKAEDHRTAKVDELPQMKTEPSVDFTEDGVNEIGENQISEKQLDPDKVALPVSEKEVNAVDVVEGNESAEAAKVDSLDQPATENTVAQNLAKQKPELSRSIFIRADVGVGLTSKKLQSLHSDWDQHTMARSTTEKPLEHLGGQLLVGYRLPSGIYAATGISFTQITERFHIVRDYSETEIMEDQVSEIHVGQDGDTTFVYTDHHVTHHFHEEVLTFNRYTMIDLPVIVGYEWYRNRWYLGLEAGIEFNLSLRTSGRMLAPTDEIIAMESSGMFRSNLSLSYLANLRVGYAVSQRFEIFLTPGVRIVPQSLLEHDVQHQAYNLYGIRLGTRIWLK